MVIPHFGPVPALATPELAHHYPADVAPLGTPVARPLVTNTSELAAAPASAGRPVRTEMQCSIFEYPIELEALTPFLDQVGDSRE